MNPTDPSQPNESVVGVFAAFEPAENAVRALHDAGLTADHISLVKRHLDPHGKLAAELSQGDDSLHEAALGGALGGLVGMAGAATLLSVTGIGLIVLTGPIVTLTGAIVGAFLGAMRGWGVHETHIRQYEQLVTEGNVLVIVAGGPVEVETAERVLRDSGARHVHLHARASTDSPEIDDRPSKG